MQIPLLSDIPVIGPMLFQQSIIVYLMYIAVAVIYVGCSTPGGACGPVRSASTRGRRHAGRQGQPDALPATSCWPASSPVSAAPSSPWSSCRSFAKDMTGGQGFIALAALIFGRWNPIGAFFAALLFGFADQPAVRAQHHRLPGAEPVPGDAAVPGDDPRGRRAGRPVPGRRPPAASRTSRADRRDRNTTTGAQDRVDWDALQAAAARGHAAGLRAVLEVPGRRGRADRRRADGLRLQRGERLLRGDPVRRMLAGRPAAA